MNNPFNRRSMAFAPVEADLTKPTVVERSFDSVSNRHDFTIDLPWSVDGWRKLNDRYDLGKVFHHEGVDYLIVGYRAEQFPHDFTVEVKLECIQPQVLLKKMAEPVVVKPDLLDRVKGQRVDIQFGKSVRKLIR